MKKILLSSLILILSSHNLSFGNTQRFVFQDNLFRDSFNYIVSLLDIKACDSHNHVEIKASATSNVLLNGYLGYTKINDILKNLSHAKNTSSQIIQAIYLTLGIFDAQSLANHVWFCYQNLKLLRQSKKIAKSNKAINLNLTNEKIKQTIWLTFNTILPYICYATYKMYSDNTIFKNAFYKDVHKSDGSSALTLPSSTALDIGKSFADSLENYRRLCLAKKIKKETRRRLR